LRFIFIFRALILNILNSKFKTIKMKDENNSSSTEPEILSPKPARRVPRQLFQIEEIPTDSFPPSLDIIPDLTALSCNQNMETHNYNNSSPSRLLASLNPTFEVSRKVSTILEVPHGNPHRKPISFLGKSMVNGENPHNGQQDHMAFYGLLDNSNLFPEGVRANPDATPGHSILSPVNLMNYMDCDANNSWLPTPNSSI
jgi:hypothetical protein